MREFFIGNRRVADDESAFVVCELGSNHGGSVETAREMIRIAKQCGCDAVKLQKRDNRSLYTGAMYGASYNSEHAYGATYGEHRQALEFGWDEYMALKVYAESLGLTFFATAFDIASAEFLSCLRVPMVKVASGDLSNWSLLQHLVHLDLPMVISTGGHDGLEVIATVDYLRNIGANFALLQCTAAYPVRHEEMNLQVIRTYRESFPDTVIGLSDHQDGISMVPVAYLLGARIFEKHFTLGRYLKGSDNAFSLEPEMMRRMVNDLKGVRLALGDGVKRVYSSEAGPMVKMGKSLVAARDLPAGHVVELGDIAIRSPGGGMKSYLISQVIGMKLERGMKQDECFA